jgi:hypothetical protein
VLGCACSGLYYPLLVTKTFSETPSYFLRAGSGLAKSPMLHGPFSTREARVDDPARREEAFRPGSVLRLEVEKNSARDVKVLLSRTDSTSPAQRDR